MKAVTTKILLAIILILSTSSCSKDQEMGRLEILSIQPLSGSCGEVITIRVDNFSSNYSNLEVFLNGKEVRVQGILGDEIRIQLNEDSESGQIELKLDDQTAISREALTVTETEPVAITELSAWQGFSGEEILIKGENFSRTPSENEVVFERDRWEVLSASSTQLRVKVPFKLNRRDKLKVTVGCHSAETTEEFWINTTAGSWNQFWNDRWHDGSPVESENFIVFSEASSREMRRQIAEEAEAALADIKSIIDYQEGEFKFRTDYEEDKIHIMADYNQQPVAGLAYRDGLIIRAKDSPRYNGDDARWQRVFQHEITHVVEFLLIGEYQHRQANTVWMREGFGNYGARNHRIQTLAQLHSWREQMKNVPGGGNPIGIRVWNDFPQSVQNAGKTIEYYGFFELAVRYLLDPEGHGKTIADLKAFYDELGLGLPVEEAFSKHFELDMDAFEAEFWGIMEGYLE